MTQNLILDNLIITVLSVVPVTFFARMMMSELTGVKLSCKSTMLMMFLEFLGYLPNALTIGPNPAYNMLIIILVMAAIVTFVYKQRGLLIVLRTVQLYGALIVVDLCGSLLIRMVFGIEFLDQGRLNYNMYNKLVCNLIPPVFYLVLFGFARLWHRLMDSYRARIIIVFHYVRPVLLIVSSVVMSSLILYRIFLQPTEVVFDEMVFSFISCLVMLAASATYVLQDIEYFKQLRRNEVLEQQIRINRSLTKNMRVFRHNIANMLYGLEGMLFRGTQEEVKKYFDDLIHRCAMIQNDNIVMLENLQSPAVVGLLLRHIDLAGQEGIPLSIHVDRGMRWHGISDANICQILGVLLDNAREATMACTTPAILVEFRNIDATAEIVIRNTFDFMGEEPDFSRSSKPDHLGVGLASVREALKKRNNAFLNIRPVGQYIEAQLLIG